MSIRTSTPLSAVLFDMDGVVTDTARAHAAAWKRLFDEFLERWSARTGEEQRAFDIGTDYRDHVDGKPRHDGIVDFLASRGIELPPGSEGDRDESATVESLARKKQCYFRAWLDDHTVRSYPGSLKLVRDLRAAGIATAVFSASRNAEAVLQSAGLLDFFDARVDGNDLARLNAPGKPDPAMLFEVAKRLGAAPANIAVIEDAAAGITAARRGGFTPIVGVARWDNDEMLRRAGADLVVRDAAELRLTPEHGLTVKTLDILPSVWDRWDELADRLSNGRFFVFLDYDGTLTPIVADHRQAFLSKEMRKAVERLAARCPVAIVSGRDLEMLRQLVQLDTVYFAGSHGFEISGPAGSVNGFQRGAEFLPDLDQAESELCEALAGIQGSSVERKRFSVAVHYRQVDEADVARVAESVDGVLSRHPRLKRGHGKKVFEVQPDIDWNKGAAVTWLRTQLGLNEPEITPVYIGDDITDEDAFRALAGRGITVVVRDRESRPSAADYTLSDTDDVGRLIERLAALASDGGTSR